MLSSEGSGLIPDAHAVARQLLLLSAHAEAAIEAFRQALPEYGLKLVMPPTDSAGPRAFASIWRPREAQAISHRASTPSHAVLRAAELEYVKRRQDEALLRCERCRGLGWFVTTAGAIEMCRHGN
jgi:hypothetical protein